MILSLFTRGSIAYHLHGVSRSALTWKLNLVFAELTIESRGRSPLNRATQLNTRLQSRHLSKASLEP